MNCVDSENKFLLCAKLCILGLLAGALGGCAGAAFSLLLAFVTHLREATPWLLLLLPLGGVVTVLLYRTFALENHRGTNEIIQCVKNESKISGFLAPLIFVSTAVTHLLGGSAGREGAALQLGGSGASAVSNVFKLKGTLRTIFIMCGMSAVFSGVFGTPFTAAFFILEFKANKKIFCFAALPCLISALVAKTCASLLGAAEEAIKLNHTATFSVSVIIKIIALAIGLGIIGWVMCFVFEKSHHWAKKIISNAIVRTLVFALIVVGLTAWVGDMRYNGSGMEMAIGAVEGKVNWFDFILKIVFTSVTLAAGFKGGEIVPTFCVGATFGCFFGGILGLDVGLAAALGLVGLFCCATNSFLSAIVLGVELFGFGALPYFVVVCIVLWLLSANDGLFENRFFKSPILIKLKK